MVIAVSWGVTWFIWPRGERVSAMQPRPAAAASRVEIDTVARSFERMAREQELQGRFKEALFSMRVAVEATPAAEREALARRSAAVDRLKRGLEHWMDESKPE